MADVVHVPGSRDRRKALFPFLFPRRIWLTGLGLCLSVGTLVAIWSSVHRAEQTRIRKSFEADVEIVRDRVPRGWPPSSRSSEGPPSSTPFTPSGSRGRNGGGTRPPCGWND